MGPPGGARNAVDPRFMSLFNIFEVQSPSSENLFTIYQVRRHMAVLPWAGLLSGGSFCLAVVCSLRLCCSLGCSLCVDCPEGGLFSLRMSCSLEAGYSLQSGCSQQESCQIGIQVLLWLGLKSL